MIVGVTPLENLLGLVGDLYCFSNTFRMLVTFVSALKHSRIQTYNSNYFHIISQPKEFEVTKPGTKFQRAAVSSTEPDCDEEFDFEGDQLALESILTNTGLQRPTGRSTIATTGLEILSSVVRPKIKCVVCLLSRSTLFLQTLPIVLSKLLNRKKRKWVLVLWITKSWE